MNIDSFHNQLKLKMHRFIMYVYDITSNFERSELYGTVSQLRRASVSIMLNNVEGFARIKPKVKLNFYETSYGSAQESKYLIYLAKQRGWINDEKYDIGHKMVDEICSMVWSTIKGLEKEINES